MQNRGVRFKLLLLVGISAVGFCAIGVFGVVNIRETFNSVDTVWTTALAFREGAQRITAPLDMLRQETLTMVVAPNRAIQDQIDERQQLLTATLDETFRGGSLAGGGPDRRRAFQRLKLDWETYKDVKDVTVRKVLEGFREEAFINAVGAERAQFDRVLRSLGAWQAAMIADADLAYEASRRRYRQVFAVSTAVVVVLTLLVGGVGYWITRMIVKPIETLRDAATRIANQASVATLGEALDERIDVDSRDELGALADAFNRMVGSLRATTDRLTEAERRTHAILNSTADGILTLGEDRNVRSVNAAGEAILKYRAHELIGRDAGLAVPALRRLGHDRTRNRPVRGDGTHAPEGDEEVYAVDRTGRRIPLALRVTELEHSGERLYIATLEDVTHRHRADEQRREIARAIRDAVGRLARATDEITEITGQQADGARQQAAAIAQTATTVEEVARTAEQAAIRADAVAESSRRANEVGEAGRHAVEDSARAMAAVQERMESIAGNIRSLAERAQAIGKIIATVDDIAEQTNVLALNASVEAARAGEHGRGFAVVATEIKSLAEQSKKGTEQVRQILTVIQQATRGSVLSTEQGTQSVAEASRVVQQAGETIVSLGNTLVDSAQAAMKISAAARQQAAGFAQLNENVRNIEHVTRENVTGLHRIEDSARRLDTLSSELESLTSTVDVVHA